MRTSIRKGRAFIANIVSASSFGNWLAAQRKPQLVHLTRGQTTAAFLVRQAHMDFRLRGYENDWI